MPRQPNGRGLFQFADQLAGGDGLPVRMAVYTGWGAVSGPSSVSNSCVGIEDLVEVEVGLVDELLERDDLADLLDCEHLVLLVTVNSETGGIVAAVF